MPYATRDGVRLFYTDTGAGDPPLLFVHGWCGDHTHWRRQLPPLRRRHRVVTVDLRGHGRSDRPEQDYTMEGFASDLEWLIGELQLQRIEAGIPGIRIGRTVGAGHFSMLEAPEQVNAMLRAFINQLGSVSR